MFRIKSENKIVGEKLNGSKNFPLSRTHPRPHPPVQPGAVVLLVVLPVLQELTAPSLRLKVLARDEVIVTAIYLPALLGP